MQQQLHNHSHNVKAGVVPAVAVAATGASAAVVGVGFVAFAVDVGYVQTRSQSTNQTSNQRTNQPASKQTSSRCLSQRVLLLLRPSGLDAVRGEQDGVEGGRDARGREGCVAALGGVCSNICCCSTQGKLNESMTFWCRSLMRVAATLSLVTTPTRTHRHTHTQLGRHT